MVGHVGWYRNRKQAIGKTLGSVQCGKGAEAKNGVLRKRGEEFSRFRIVLGDGQLPGWAGHCHDCCS